MAWDELEVSWETLPEETRRIARAVRGRTFEARDLFNVILGPHDGYDGVEYADDQWGKSDVFLQRVSQIAPGRWFSNPRPAEADDVIKADFFTLHDVHVPATSRAQDKTHLRDLFAQDPDAVTWSEVAVVVQLTDLDGRAEERVYLQGLPAAHALLGQPGRLFALVLTVRRECFQLVLASASGVFESRIVKATQEPNLVAHALSRIPHLAALDYGLDIRLCPVARCQHAHPVPDVVPGYSLTEVLRSREDIVGPCKTLLRLDPTDPRVPRQGPLLLKLAFPDVRHDASTTEAEILGVIEKSDPQLAAGLARRITLPGAPSVPVFQTNDIHQTLLKMTDTNTDADTLERKQGEKGLIVRELTAVLLRPAGVPCTRYMSASHFWKGMIAAVEAHRRLYRLGYIHRDVSTSSIMLSADPDAPQSGYLVDYDLATKVDECASHGTGTYPFLAIELLDEPSTRHEVRHDLESFYYVIIWVCSLYGEPTGQRADWHLTEDRLVDAPRSSAGTTLTGSGELSVRDWNELRPLRVWCLKKGILNKQRLHTAILDQIDPFWRPLVDGQVFDGLRQVVQTLVSGQPGTVDEQYDGFLAALNRGLHVLEQQEQQ